jgi:hypothetical protein
VSNEMSDSSLLALSARVAAVSIAAVGRTELVLFSGGGGGGVY